MPFYQVINKIIKIFPIDIKEIEKEILKADLGINPNTVMKAYQELEKNGYIYTLNKKGVFVSKDLAFVSNNNLEHISYVLNSLKDEGYSKQDLLKVLDEVYKNKEEDDA